MSGSGGNGGYEYQAKGIAYVAVHILTAQQLDWIEQLNDIPIAVATETLGPGDDLNIKLKDGAIIELQAKHGLQKPKLWDPILKLIHGLHNDESLYGILLTDSTASRVITDDLRTDIKRLGQDRRDNLKGITEELLNKMSEQNIPCNPNLFKRLSIRVLDLDDGLPNSESASRLLSQILEDSNQSGQAWKNLCAEGSNLMTHRGRRDQLAWLQPLNKDIKLVATRDNPAIIRETYRHWLQNSTEKLIVPGMNVDLSIESDWLQLQAMHSERRSRPFKAAFIPEITDCLSLIVGDSGTGKSTLMQYLAHRLSSIDKIAIRVRLTSVFKLYENYSFSDAILKDATNNSTLSLDQSRLHLSHPHYLLADGLDECEGNQGTICEQLRSWATGHSNTKIIITTRSGNYEMGLLPDFQRIELCSLKNEDIFKFSERILENPVTAKEFKNWLETSNTMSLAAKNPLLLGFLIQIFQDQSEPVLNRAILYKKIISLAYKHQLQNRQSITIRESTAQRILAIAGWTLLNKPEIIGHDLKRTIADELSSELSSTTLETENQVEDTLSFWEQRRILERRSHGCDDSLIFIHSTLKEYSAACYAYDMDKVKFRNWFEEVCQSNPQKWKGVCYFLAHLGLEEEIVSQLLEINSNSNHVDSNKLLMAVEILNESSEYPPVFFERIVLHFQEILRSSEKDLVSRTTDSLISFSENSSILLENISKSLLEHHQDWTRFSAIRLAIAAGYNIDSNILEATIDKFIEEAEASHYTSDKVVNRFGVKIWKPDEVLIDCLRELLNIKVDIETLERVRSVVTDKVMSCKTSEVLRSIIENKEIELLCASRNGQGDDISCNSPELRQELTRLKNIILQPFKSSFSGCFPNEHNAQIDLARLKRNQEKANIDKSLLEQIIKVVNTPYQNQSNYGSEFPLLGILVQSLFYWEMTEQERRAINQTITSNDLEIIIKSLIHVLQIDKEQLNVEANTLLKMISHENLHEIEAVLNKGIVGGGEDFFNAYTKLLEISVNHKRMSFYIPQVPAFPKWERLKSIDLSISTLEDALGNPSGFINYNAMVILVHKIGKEETISIMKRKGFSDAMIEDLYSIAKA